jgi:outer membrane protein
VITAENTLLISKLSLAQCTTEDFESFDVVDDTNIKDENNIINSNSIYEKAKRGEQIKIAEQI